MDTAKPEPSDSNPTPTGPSRKRIETQIHRRRKVKATLPFKDEWDLQSGKKPQGLRTPKHNMKP